MNESGESEGSTNTNQLTYLVGDWQQDLLPNGQIIRIRHARLVERHIEVEARPGTAANVIEVRLTQVRPEGSVFEAMDGEVEHPRVIVEHLLCSLAVMHVKIDDKNPLHLAVIDGVLCRDGHVVEEAVPVILGFHGMVTRRPDYGHSILDLAQQDLIDQLNGASNGQFRQFEGCL